MVCVRLAKHNVMDSCTHLTPEQCTDLFQLLSKFDVLFNVKLKTFVDEVNLPQS